MKKTKKFLSILLSLLMVVSALPMTVFANDTVAYIDRSWNGSKVVDTTKTVTDYELVTAETTTMSAGTFYVVSGNVTISNRIVIEGTTDAPTSIILTDGCTLNANKGIQLHSGKALNVYGQADDTGKLRATAVPSSGYAGIGGDQASSGSLTVYGGDVYASGGVNASGIGGGWDGSAGSFTMYGGTVEAEAYNIHAAGIGKGRGGDDGEFTVYCDVNIVAGDSAPGTETNVDDYKNSRKKYVKIVPSNVHIHDWADETCTEPKTCKSCGETFGAPLGHSYTIQGELISEATCSKADVYVYKCERCDSTTQKEVGAMLDHTFVDGVCTVCKIGEFIVDENGVLTGYNGDGGDIVIPDGVTAIGNYTFKNCTSLTSVVIPDSVTTIGDYAFSKCTSLTSVVIPDSVTTIGDYAFSNCTSLTSVVIPDSVTTIGKFAFLDCVRLTSIVIPDSVTIIGIGAFTNCFRLTSVVIPDSVTTIGNNAFKSCPNLKTINYYCNNDLEKIKTLMQPYDTGFEYNPIHNMLPATCTEPKHCACYELTEGKPLGHNWQKATCTEPKTCLRCAEIDGEPNGHNYLEYGIVTTETCTDPAYYEGVCTICGDYSDSIPEGEPLGHVFNAKGELVTPATCTTPAVYKLKCIRCRETNGTIEGEPLGHDMLPATCTEPKHCSRCDHTEGEILGHDYDLVINDYVYTYSCKNCDSSYVVDKTALANAIKTAQDEYLNDPLLNEKYQWDQIDDLKSAVNGGKVKLADQNIKQDKVNIGTSRILDAISDLTRCPKTYSVTVNKITDGDSTVIATADVVYGEMFNYSVKLEENQAIYKWVMETDERDVKLNTISQDISQVITGDATFNCYIDNADTKAEDTARVVFYDKGNRVIGLDYVTIGSSISYNVEAPKVAFYDFIGWETVSGDPTNVDKSGVSLRATYAPKDIADNKSTIVALGDIKVNGKQTTTEFYDVKITLTGADSYAYCDADGNILQGINGNVIYAPNNAQTIYVCAGTSNKASTSITGAIDDANKLTINAQYYLPSDCTVVEAGIVISKTNESPTINGAECVALKSSQQGPSGEYSISMGYSSGKTGVINAVSYLTYKDSQGALHTIYSETQSITFGE